VHKFIYLFACSVFQFELDTASFLQYVTDTRALTAAGCDGSFECSDYQEQGEAGGKAPVEDTYYKPAAQPKKVTFPVGRLPRQAKCFLQCAYKQTYEFNVGNLVPANADEEATTFAAPTHATRAHAHHASSFLETEATEQARGTPADAIPVNNIGSPFHCQTSCEFPQPLFCNPVRRMVVGSAGFTPQEHPCCELCEAKCRSKTVIDRFRVCYLGCRAFCPFAG
jgi:hypothetical protein